MRFQVPGIKMVHRHFSVTSSCQLKCERKTSNLLLAMFLLPKEIMQLAMLHTNMKGTIVHQHTFVKHVKRHYKSQLEEHVKLHTGEGMIPCIGCNRKFNTKSAMNAHAINHQNRTFDCTECSKSITSPAYLN